jgi:hypothetical protein
MSNHQIVQTLEEHPKLRDFLSLGEQIASSTGMIKSAAGASAYLVEQATRRTHLSPWYEGIIDGAGLQKGDARLLFRRVMFNMTRKQAGQPMRRRDTREHVALCIKAFNAWRTGITVVLSSGDILLLTLGGLTGVALWGAIGAGLAAIIHNQVGAVIAILAWGLVVDDLLFGLAPAVGRFTPTRASDALMGLRVHHLVSPGAGAIVLIAWAGALGVVGISVSRQDIN